MNEKILGLKYPPITSWQWQANLFAILTTEDKAWPWLFSNYIMISCVEEQNKGRNPMWLDFVPSGPYALVDCPWLTVSVIERELISEKNIEKYLIDIIDKDFYIYGFFDEKDLININTTAYHDLFIHGYNKKKHIFYVADFIFKDKYSFESVNMDKLTNGYLSPEIKGYEILYAKGGLMLIKKNYLNIYNFNKKLVYTSFYNYLNPKYFLDFQDIRTQYFENKKYGIEVYDMIIEWIKKLYEDDKFEVTTLHNLYDHKVLMVLRIEYMLKNGYLTLNHNILNNFIDIKNKMNIVWISYLKIEVSQKKNNDKIKKIINDLQNIKIKETELYSVILDDLEKNMGKDV
jgi:hypothetical protein